MSNNVRIFNGITHLKLHEFDIPRFKAVHDRVKGLKSAPAWEQDSEGYLTWWFLDNSVFVDNYNVLVGFGEGRSEWSWRSMRASLMFVSSLMRVRKVVQWRMSDASDGYEKVYWFRLDLKVGMLPEKASKPLGKVVVTQISGPK